MRIVDGKGRLFGMINLIDLFVLVLVAALIGSFIVNLQLKVCGRRSDSSVEKLIKVRFTVLDQVLDNKKVLQSGDKVLAGKATIVKVLKVVPISAADVTAMDGKPAIYSDKVLSVLRGWSDVTVLIKAACAKLHGEYYCTNVPIKINSPITIYNEFYTLEKGVILDIDGRSNGND